MQGKLNSSFDNAAKIHKVFGIKGKYRKDMIVAGDVLEQMLREGLVGFQTVPVSAKEGTPWQKNT